MNISKINSSISLDYLTKEKENLYFERKRAKISFQDLANEIAAFANANGGVIVVGITDDGVVEGLNNYGINKLNDFQKVVTNYLKQAPKYNLEIIDIKNYKQLEDKILLYHIEPADNFIVINNKDEVYMRQGDSSIRLRSDQIKSLEYDRRERDFENELIINSSVNDIDLEVMEIYKSKINTSLSNEEVLKARGFLREKDGKLNLTKAGMLLFGKNPSIYLPSARVRIVKFDGTEFQVGTKMNIIKDRTFDKCLFKAIEESSEFIKSQLREFTHLNQFGIFETVPEYPEFAWYEGLVNAVTHRDYSNSGEFITIKMFDDRLEILSPGRLGGFVTIETMKTKRYSRNPIISRVLTEFGIVRELNEGVKRIYSEMEKFFLREPIYSEPDKHSVLLVLDNNIMIRANRKTESLKNIDNIKNIWSELSYPEQLILQMLSDKKEITALDVEKLINRGKTTSIKVLNKLIEKELIVWTGTSKKDNKGKYIMK